MKIYNLSILLFIFGFCFSSFAQEAQKQYLLEKLKDQKSQIQNEERARLKSRIKEVNEALFQQEISESEADSLKLKYAEETALQIEEKVLSVETEYYENGLEYNSPGEEEIEDYIHNYTRGKRERKSFYSNDLVFAAGLNNLIEEEIPFENTAYEFIKSFFVELGWSWKVNLIPNSGLINLRYGFSFQFNSLRPKDKGIFTNTGGTIERIPYSQPLIRNQLQYTNLVFPIHIELGSNRKQQNTYTKDGSYVQRTYHRNSFIVGGGAYGGFNIHNIQRIKAEGFKNKIKNDLNFNDLVYGVSGYISFPRMLTLYAKADLSPLFKDQNYLQNNISLGIRFDIN